MRAIVPVHELRRRVVEQGRIRMGVKVMLSGVDKSGNQKSRPEKLRRFRFTTQDRDAIDVIAEKYGGKVDPWAESPTPETWQVTVTEAKIPVVLPPDPLGGSPIYELWSGGGCQRRCDGIDCTLPLPDSAADDAEQSVVPCVCRAQQRRLCKPTTRLNVVLRDIPFGGVWRLESKGWNAAEELPGEVEMIEYFQSRGFNQAELSIGSRTSLVRGKTKQFIVPMLTLPDTIMELAAGSMSVAALGQMPRAALPAGRVEETAPAADEGEWFDEDDEVVDAEIVDDEDPDAAEDDGSAPNHSTPSAASAPRRVQAPRVKALHAAIRDICRVPEMSGDVDVFRHALVKLVTKGRSESSSELTEPEQSEALNVCADLLSGERRLIGFADDGHLRVSARKEAT